MGEASRRSHLCARGRRLLLLGRDGVVPLLGVGELGIDRVAAAQDVLAKTFGDLSVVRPARTPYWIPK